MLTSSLDEVVGFATEENPHQRADSAMAWLNLLLATATTPVAPTDAPFAHPLQATPGQRLADNLEVVDILGSGSTARVLRVRRDGTDYALKVALSPELEDRVRRRGLAYERLAGLELQHLHAIALEHDFLAEPVVLVAAVDLDVEVARIIRQRAFLAGLAIVAIISLATLIGFFAGRITGH